MAGASVPAGNSRCGAGAHRAASRCRPLFQCRQPRSGDRPTRKL